MYRNVWQWWTLKLGSHKLISFEGPGSQEQPKRSTTKRHRLKPCGVVHNFLYYLYCWVKIEVWLRKDPEHLLGFIYVYMFIKFPYISIIACTNVNNFGKLKHGDCNSNQSQRLECQVILREIPCTLTFNFIRKGEVTNTISGSSPNSICFVRV